MGSREKSKKPVALVDSWLADKSWYDRRVWPRLARAIERNRLSSRRRLLGRAKPTGR